MKTLREGLLDKTNKTQTMNIGRMIKNLKVECHVRMDSFTKLNIKSHIGGFGVNDDSVWNNVYATIIYMKILENNRIIESADSMEQFLVGEMGWNPYSTVSAKFEGKVFDMEFDGKEMRIYVASDKRRSPSEWILITSHS